MLCSRIEPIYEVSGFIRPAASRNSRQEPVSIIFPPLYLLTRGARTPSNSFAGPCPSFNMCSPQTDTGIPPPLFFLVCESVSSSSFFFFFFLSMEAFDRSQSLPGLEVDHKSFITPIVHIF
jgi:hypothetical protein